MGQREYVPLLAAMLADLTKIGICRTWTSLHVTATLLIMWRNRTSMNPCIPWIGHGNVFSIPLDLTSWEESSRYFTTTEPLICPGWETHFVPVSQTCHVIELSNLAVGLKHNMIDRFYRMYTFQKEINHVRLRPKQLSRNNDMVHTCFSQGCHAPSDCYCLCR